VEITFLIGAARYAVLGEDAHHLEGVIREECADLHGQPHNESARACLQLADELREYLQRGSSPEPIELGRSQVEGLCEYVVEHREIAGVALLADLCDALKRYQVEEIPSRGA
jgi:dsDNA-binding SOS-regulon protein